MTHVLHIDSSAAMTGSSSRAGTAAILKDLNPTTITTRDLAADPLPQITQDWSEARLIPEAERSDAQKAILAQSDALVTELQNADMIVIGLPVYNFSMPASLKAWIDLVARPQVTFRYTENGPEGLLHGKSAIIVYAAGGVTMDSPVDFATPLLRQVLNFVGITEIKSVLATDAVAAQVA